MTPGGLPPPPRSPPKAARNPLFDQTADLPYSAGYPSAYSTGYSVGGFGAGAGNRRSEDTVNELISPYRGRL